MRKDLLELAKRIWILRPHVISLQKTFLDEDSFTDYVNTMTHYMNVKQFISPATSPCLLSGVMNKEFMTARIQVKYRLSDVAYFVQPGLRTQVATLRDKY